MGLGHGRDDRGPDAEHGGAGQPAALGDRAAGHARAMAEALAEEPLAGPDGGDGALRAGGAGPGGAERADGAADPWTRPTWAIAWRCGWWRCVSATGRYRWRDWPRQVRPPRLREPEKTLGVGACLATTGGQGSAAGGPVLSLGSAVRRVAGRWLGRPATAPGQRAGGHRGRRRDDGRRTGARRSGA